MTPAEFEHEMKRVTAMKEIAAVKTMGIALIIKALGAGAPAYMPGLIAYMNRLESEPGYTPKVPPRPII